MSDLSATARREILESEARFAAFWWGSVILTSLLVFPVHYMLMDEFWPPDLAGFLVYMDFVTSPTVTNLKQLWVTFAEIYPLVFLFATLPFGLILWKFAWLAFGLLRRLLRRWGPDDDGATLNAAALLSLASAATVFALTGRPFWFTAGLVGLLAGPLMAWGVYRRAWGG